MELIHYDSIVPVRRSSFAGVPPPPFSVYTLEKCQPDYSSIRPPPYRRRQKKGFCPGIRICTAKFLRLMLIMLIFLACFIVPFVPVFVDIYWR
ncbi:hypothetical protein L596_020249 [Steinernema carpocapsae]|uniref:Uncharacterized protein n=1 Tax=Steinernema carpocapsae TaxID=34508 RepID=A0A4U5MSY8_STECR|nr:hypothetical protein L596_020249 [Steinernema carpocapsae]